MLKDLVLKSRTYRRFYQDIPVERETLMELVDLARCQSPPSLSHPSPHTLTHPGDANLYHGQVMLSSPTIAFDNY